MHIYCECSFSDIVNMQRNDFCGLNNQLVFILLTMMLNRRLYFSRVKLGNPAKEFYVQIDTGSDILWVTCSSCAGCPTSSGLNVRPAVPQSPQDDIFFRWFSTILLVLFDNELRRFKFDGTISFRSFTTENYCRFGHFLLCRSNWSSLILISHPHLRP